MSDGSSVKSARPPQENSGTPAHSTTWQSSETPRLLDHSRELDVKQEHELEVQLHYAEALSLLRAPEVAVVEYHNAIERAPGSPFAPAAWCGIAASVARQRHFSLTPRLGVGATLAMAKPRRAVKGAGGPLGGDRLDGRLRPTTAISPPRPPSPSTAPLTPPQLQSTNKR
jgi:hypothetical protein